MIKKTLLAATMLASTSVTQAEITARNKCDSDYVFRGISQTDNQFAIQGGFDWEHSSGFYLGTWASNVDSDFFGGAKDPQIELDLYGGFAGDFGDGGLGYDVGYIRYEYPGGGSNDTNEIYGALSYGGFTGQVNYSDELNFSGDDGDGWYWFAGYDTEFSGVGLSASIGYSMGDAWDVVTDGSYVDWSLGAFDTEGCLVNGDAYYDTNLSNSDCGSSTLCDTKFIASISKSF